MGKGNRLRRISQLENRESARGSFPGKHKDDKVSMSVKDETISKSRELNQVLITKTGSLKEETEAGKRMEDDWKEAQRELSKDISGLQQQVNDVAIQHSDSVQQYKVTENSPNEQSYEMLYKEVVAAMGLLEMKNHSHEELRKDINGLQQHANDAVRQQSDSVQQCNEMLYKEVVAAMGLLEMEDQRVEELRKDINVFRQQVNDAVRQQSDSVQHCKVTENSPNEQNEMLHKEVGAVRCLFEMKNDRLEKQLQEKEEQRTEFGSLHAESAWKYRELEEKQIQQLMAERQHLQQHVLENRKPSNVQEAGITDLQTADMKSQNQKVKALSSQSKI